MLLCNLTVQHFNVFVSSLHAHISTIQYLFVRSVITAKEVGHPDYRKFISYTVVILIFRKFLLYVNTHIVILILKVHKIENFFDSDFGIGVISLLVMSKYEDFTKKFFGWAIIGGGTIFPHSPRTTQNEKKF